MNGTICLLGHSTSEGVLYFSKIHNMKAVLETTHLQLHAAAAILKALKVRPHRTPSAAADCGLCPLRTAVSVRCGLRSLSAAECYILSRLF